MNLSAKKGLYGAASVIATLSGTACGVLGGMMVGVARMHDISSVKGERIPEDAVRFLKDDAQRLFVDDNILYCILLAVAFIAAVVGLSILTGQFSKDEEGKIKLNWFDRMWTEFHILLLTFASTGAVALAFPIVGILPSVKWFNIYVPLQPNEFVFGIGNKNIMILCIAGMTI